MKDIVRFLAKEFLRKKHFQIEVTNVCNLKCPACPWHTVMNRKLHTMTVEEWNIIFNKIHKNARSIGFYVMGEPLLNKNIFVFVSDAKHKNIYTQFSTNGMLVGDYIDEIIDCGLDQLQVAIDGFEAKTHEEYRVGSDFSKIINNLIRLQEKKKQLGVSHPEIRIQTLVNGKNENQINKIKEFCDTNGFVFQTKAMHLGRNDEIRLHMKKNGYETTLKSYQRYGKNVSYYKNRDVCPQLDNITVLCNGDVVPCCFDYDGTVSWGNLVNESWPRIRWGRKRISFLVGFLYKKNVLCDSCDML